MRDGESINRDKERPTCDPEVASSNPGRGNFLPEGRFCLFQSTFILKIKMGYSFTFKISILSKKYQ